MKKVGMYNFAKAQNPRTGVVQKLKSNRRLWNSAPQLTKYQNKLCQIKL
jgi:hypothetical protein